MVEARLPGYNPYAQIKHEDYIPLVEQGGVPYDCLRRMVDAANFSSCPGRIRGDLLHLCVRHLRFYSGALQSFEFWFECIASDSSSIEPVFFPSPKRSVPKDNRAPSIFADYSRQSDDAITSFMRVLRRFNDAILRQLAAADRESVKHAVISVISLKIHHAQLLTSQESPDWTFERLFNELARIGSSKGLCVTITVTKYIAPPDVQPEQQEPEVERIFKMALDIDFAEENRNHHDLYLTALTKRWRKLLSLEKGPLIRQFLLPLVDLLRATHINAEDSKGENLMSAFLYHKLSLPQPEAIDLIFKLVKRGGRLSAQKLKETQWRKYDCDLDIERVEIYNYALRTATAAADADR